MLFAVAGPTEGIQREERADSSLAREVLDVLRVDATTEHDREATVLLLTPPDPNPHATPVCVLSSV